MGEYAYERQAYIPEGYDKEPETVLEALQQARTVLVEEGRWMQGQWFVNAHPEMDPEDAFCNDWKVCAEGAVAIVTTGVLRCKFVPSEGDPEKAPFVVNQWQYDVDHLPKVQGLDTEGKQLLYDQARAILKRAGREVFGFTSEDAWKYNDSFLPNNPELNRTRILGWFDTAIAMAELETANA